MEEVVEVLKIDDVNLAMLEEIDVITTMVDDALLLACIGLVEVLTMNVVIEGVKDIELFTGVIDTLDMAVDVLEGIGVVNVEIMDDGFEDTSILEVGRMILDMAYLELEKLTLFVVVKMDDVTINVLTPDTIEREDGKMDETRDVLKKDKIILWLKILGEAISVLDFSMDGVNKRDNFDVADTIEEVMDIGLVE